MRKFRELYVLQTMKVKNSDFSNSSHRDCLGLSPTNHLYSLECCQWFIIAQNKTIVILLIRNNITLITSICIVSHKNYKTRVYG